MFADRIYEKKWSGLCYNDQQDPGQKLYNVGLDDCQDKCSQNTDCIAYGETRRNLLDIILLETRMVCFWQKYQQVCDQRVTQNHEETGRE